MFSSSRYKGKRKAAGDRSRRFYVRIFYTTNLYLPTGSLDTQNTQEILRLLKASNETYRQTIILITHDREIALQTDRILEIQDGGLIRDEVIR